MSGTDIETLKEPDPVDDSVRDQVDGEQTVEEHSTKNDENPMSSTQKEEEILKKKYGGIIPKKPPLISKDHERAFFDSADWALGKQGGAQKPKGPLEALRPKLQPTPHHQSRSRRSAYAPADDVEDGSSSDTPTSEDHGCALDGESNNKNTPEEQINHE